MVHRDYSASPLVDATLIQVLVASRPGTSFHLGPRLTYFLSANIFPLSAFNPNSARVFPPQFVPATSLTSMTWPSQSATKAAGTSLNASGPVFGLHCVRPHPTLFFPFGHYLHGRRCRSRRSSHLSADDRCCIDRIGHLPPPPAAPPPRAVLLFPPTLLRS